jgi:hypothetical protein
MDGLDYSSISMMTIVAHLKSKCNLEEIYKVLPINDKFISLKFHQSTNTHTKVNEAEKQFVAIMNGMRRSIDSDHIEITLMSNFKYKSIKLHAAKAIILGCVSITEGLSIINEIAEACSNFKIEVADIKETSVTYKYRILINVDVNKIIKHFDKYENFTVGKSKKSCVINYDNNRFVIQNDKVIQTSINMDQAVKAYDVFLKELRKINV